MNIVARAAEFFRPGPTAVKVGPIGIDFGLESVHLVQLEAATGKPPEVRARASLAYNSPRREILENPLQFRSLIKRALDADRFRGRKAVIATPK